MPNIALRRPAPACSVPDALAMHRGGGDARDLVHGLGQSVRARLRGRRRRGARPRRHQRHRHDGDRARQAVRAEGDRHLRVGREMRAGARSSARRAAINYRTQDFVEEVKAPPAASGSRSCSTWSAATICRATSPASPMRAGTFDRLPARSQGRDRHPRHHAAAADPDRIDAPRRALSSSRRWSPTKSPAPSGPMSRAAG